MVSLISINNLRKVRRFTNRLLYQLSYVGFTLILLGIR